MCAVVNPDLAGFANDEEILSFEVNVDGRDFGYSPLSNSGEAKAKTGYNRVLPNGKQFLSFQFSKVLTTGTLLISTRESATRCIMALDTELTLR